MNELFEQHIKHFPHMLKYCFYEVKTHYKYYVSAFAIMLVLLIFTYLKLWITDAIDVQQSTSYYKLIGFSLTCGSFYHFSILKRQSESKGTL